MRERERERDVEEGRRRRRGGSETGVTSEKIKKESVCFEKI